MKNIGKNNSGLILMVSLWILALISLLSLGLAHRVIVNQKIVGFGRDKMKSLYIAKAAVNKAINVLVSDDIDSDTLSDLWSTGYDTDTGSEIFKDIHVGDGSFTISYIYDDTDPNAPRYFYGMSDEERKININLANIETLEALFTVLGFDDPNGLAEYILYWRGDAGSVVDSYYNSADMPYGPRQAPLKTIEELSLIKGFREDPTFINKCKRYLTAYTGSIEVNANTAGADVLRAIFKGMGADAVTPDFSQRLAEYIIDYRNGQDNQDGTQDDVAIRAGELKQLLIDKFILTPETLWLNNQSFFFTDKSDLFRIEVSTKLDNSRVKKKLVAIFSRAENKIKYWHEE